MNRGRLVRVLVGASSGGLLVLALILTPEFIERYLSPDGVILDQTRAVMVMCRLGMACAGVLIAMLWIVRRPLIRYLSRSEIDHGRLPCETLSARGLMATPRFGRLEAVLWFALPVWLVVVNASFVFHIQWPRFLVGEYGVVENATALLYLVAGVFAMIIVVRGRSGAVPVGYQRWWMLPLGAFCLFVAGEEVNWGQTYFYFRTPEAVLAVNQQEQFSLHNVWIPAHLPLPQAGWDHFLGHMLCVTGAIGPWLLCVSKRLRCLAWTWEIPVPPLLSQAYFAAGALMPTEGHLFGYQMRPTETRELSLAVAFAIWVFSERNRWRIYAGVEAEKRRDSLVGSVSQDRGSHSPDESILG